MTASDLPHDWREWYEERAAILEYMANLSRKQAEARALADARGDEEGGDMNAQAMELIDPDDISPECLTPFDNVAAMELRRNAGHILATLKPRERDIVERHLGLFDDKSATLVAIAKDLKVTPPRVREIFCKGMRKLRHPARSRYLRAFIWEDQDRPATCEPKTEPPIEPPVVKVEPQRCRPKHWKEFAAYWVGTFDTHEERTEAAKQLKASHGWRGAYLTQVYFVWAENKQAEERHRDLMQMRNERP